MPPGGAASTQTRVMIEKWMSMHCRADLGTDLGGVISAVFHDRPRPDGLMRILLEQAAKELIHVLSRRRRRLLVEQSRPTHAYVAAAQMRRQEHAKQGGQAEQNRSIWRSRELHLHSKSVCRRGSKGRRSQTRSNGDNGTATLPTPLAAAPGTTPFQRGLDSDGWFWCRNTRGCIETKL